MRTGKAWLIYFQFSQRYISGWQACPGQTSPVYLVLVRVRTSISVNRPPRDSLRCSLSFKCVAVYSSNLVAVLLPLDADRWRRIAEDALSNNGEIPLDLSGDFPPKSWTLWFFTKFNCYFLKYFPDILNMLKSILQ